jgi:hypothetical protein
MALLFLTASPAQAHLVRHFHKGESAAQELRIAKANLGHVIYVCARGSGKVKRSHCRAERWLRRVIERDTPHPVVSYSGDWSATLYCETGGTNDWHTNTGNGYFGGLQFDHQTWISHGGGAYASDAYLATPAQQMAIASRLDYDAWPNCPNP